MRKHLLLFFIFPYIFSCVSVKNSIYLQGDSLQKKEIKRINNIPYKLQVNDVLFIGITSNDESLVQIFSSQTSKNSYFSNYPIDDLGLIRIPNLGPINVLGYTTREVRKIIENELEKFIKKSSDIFVSVKLSGIKYTIIGEISKPGVQVVSQNKLSIIDAIAISGDITKDGNLKQVEVIRKSISGTEKFFIDLTTMNAFNSEVFYISHNDIINITPSKKSSLNSWTDSLLPVSGIITLITSIMLIVNNT